jgi:uncharacterized membrane protein
MEKSVLTLYRSTKRYSVLELKILPSECGDSLSMNTIHQYMIKITSLTLFVSVTIKVFLIEVF